MKPKQRSHGTKPKCKTKTMQYKVCHKDVESFKLKFHPQRFSNQENHPQYKAPEESSTIQSNSDQTSESKLASISRIGVKALKRKKPSCAKYLCHVCCAMFKTSANLKEHLKIHSSVKEYKCSYCDYSCHRKRNMKIHELTHGSKKPIQCSLCDYSCIQKFQLKAHLLLHETETPFKCNICDAKYKKEAGLKVHMLTHANHYKFKCHHCQYPTNRFADYRRHLLIHSKAKPEKCPYCSYSCIRRSRLRAHLLVHRGDNIVGGEDSVLSRLGNKLVHCQQCDYVCITASSLKKHMKSHCVKKNEFALMLEKTFAFQDTVDQQQGSTDSVGQQQVPAPLVFPHQENQASIPIETNYPTELLVLTENPLDPLSVFAAPLKQELLLNPTESHQIIFTQAQSDSDMFSDPSSLFVASEHQTLLLAAPFIHQEPNALVQSEQPVLMASTNPTWVEEHDWPDTDPFPVDQLGTFSFDPIIQPANNFIVTVVKEERPLETFKEELVPPVDRNHSKSKMYHCALCSFSCDYKSTYKKHARKHENLKNYKCAHCHYMCDQLFRMKKHLIRHTHQKLFQCDTCQFSCKSKPTLQQHILTHSKGGKSGSGYHCPHCDYSCKSMPGLKSHLAKHTGDNNYQCDICEEKLASEYLLKKHKFTHGVRPYQCQYCSYSCVQKQQMNTHMLQHTLEYPFCCQLCSAKYKKQDSLKIHFQSQHENKHRFVCDLCNYAGNRAADFREHMLTHSAQKPFQCSRCSYSCIRGTQLRKHMTLHDKAESTESRVKGNKKMYHCAFCDFTCMRTLRLKAHLAKVHLDLSENLVFSFDSTPDQINIQQTEKVLPES
ncbi:zinc finger protein ZFAT [Biomphalaria glabrata]|nr:zinc finger protein ZFAT-like [Biomphalaria glabrata]